MRKDRYTVVLDDDPSAHRIIEGALGIKSLPFSSAADLVAAASKLKPIATFLDIHLGQSANIPGALDILPFLRGQWPYCPLIVVTADPPRLW